MPTIDLTAVDGLIESHLGSPGAVIAILQAIQEEYRYLPREVFPKISRALGASEAKIFSVATFYENFSLEPKGLVIIKVCDGTACHVRRSPPILARLRQDLGLAEGKVTTADLMFTVETVACLGACGLAPVLTLNGKAYPAMTPDKAQDLLSGVRAKLGGAARGGAEDRAACGAVETAAAKLLEAEAIGGRAPSESEGGGHA
jgi:NADH-quinone oxidoreductase subunit E